MAKTKLSQQAELLNRLSWGQSVYLVLWGTAEDTGPCRPLYAIDVTGLRKPDAFNTDTIEFDIPTVQIDRFCHIVGAQFARKKADGGWDHLVDMELKLSVDRFMPGATLHLTDIKITTT